MRRPLDGSAPNGDPKLSDRLYASIVDGIIQGEYPPDSRLPSETSLARRFAVSRPVVREALARLRDHGLITSRQGSGSFVRRQPDPAMLSFTPLGSLADLQRCFEFRGAFEGRAAALAAERHDRTTLAGIESRFMALELITQGEALGVDADFAFHMAVAEAARNHFFTSTLAMLEQHIAAGMNVTRSLSLLRPRDRLALVQAEHRQILDAIRQRDAATAEAAMVAHIDNARRRMFDGHEPRQQSGEQHRAQG